MKRTDLINYFIAKYGYKSYLEIGVQVRENNFNHIIAGYKIGVDPDDGGTYKMTSDDFFLSLENPAMYETFDFIFIDGLHHSTQVLKDFNNAMNYINEGGTIMFHDCNPQTIELQMVPRPKPRGPWNGDTWRTWIEVVKAARHNMEVAYCIDTDEGCGIVENIRKPFKVGQNSAISWKEFARDRKRRLNLITIEEWKSKQGTDI